MARLNDPAQQDQQQQPTMYSAETVEALRRKMLRQNRELARTNSTQAIRLRQLEAECARMLSENLELRSVILRMETEAENNKAARIADHALEIKAQLEAQLAGFSDLLASLGNEPPAKRQSLSPSSRKIATPKSVSRRRSASHKVLRDMAKEVETRAREEGRLTPIMEHTSYPRISEGPEQLLATQQTCTLDNSPSSAPRISSASCSVDEVLLLETPTKKTTSNIQVRITKSQSTKPQQHEPSQDVDAHQSVETVSTKRPTEQREPVLVISTRTSKRKHGNEQYEPIPSSDSDRDSSLTRASSIRDKTKGKNLKELAALRREAQEKQNELVEVSRKPLSAKSTNKDLSVARHTGKENIKGGENSFSVAKHGIEGEKEKATTVRENSRIRNREQLQQTFHTIKPSVSTPKRPVTVEIIPDNDEHVGNDSDLLTAKSPEPQAAGDMSRLGDTPPPAHISSNGETSRPSRRARASVSYAEPNLRDKMRRPTKELFDAVAGEGKYMRRSSSSKQDVMPEVVPKPRASIEAIDVVETNNSQVSDISTITDTTNAEEDEFLPSSVVTDRRKRRSSVAVDSANNAGKTALAKPVASDGPKNVDLYEFITSSPAATAVMERRSYSKRRASAAVVDTDSAVAELDKPVRASRKRATMAAPKRSRADMEASLHDESEGSQTDGSSIFIAPRTKAALRRKSTLT
ncbi:hypothetical protein BROUX41_003054 [Berkeleyomyces rouxiae]